MDKKRKETVKGNKKGEKRDKKGQFKKGTKGGPGRLKGEARDLVCAGGKRHSVGALVEDLLGTYNKLGSNKFLLEWALSSKRNLTLFIQLLYKFAPQPVEGDDREFKPLIVKVEKIISDRRPAELETYPQSHQGLEDQLHELRKEIRERDNEIERFKGIFKAHDIDPGVIQHEPIIDALPVHDEDEEDHSDRRDK